jgi:fatty acid desaturase
MTEPITEERVRAQAWKYYFVLLAWPAYLFVLPAVYARAGWWSAAYMVFPGVYLFTWTGYLMHETWHKYVPNVPNGLFYNLYSWMLVTDPQVYRALHGYHHSAVHTWDDTEFHPLGEIKDGPLLAVYNFCEIFLGIIFISVLGQLVMPGHPVHGKNFSARRAALSGCAIALFLGGVLYLSHLAFGVSASQALVPLAASLWLNSFVIHHSQLVEHGGLIVEGDFGQRNLWARNLSPAGPAEKLFLFFTHGDSREHVLHHTLPRVYSRPFPGALPLPEKAVRLTLADYLRVLGRMLAGRTERVTA